MALLLGLMIYMKTEKCSFYIFSSGNPCFLQVNLKDLTGDFFHDIEYLKQESYKLGGGTYFPISVVESWISSHTIIDSSIVLSDMMIS
jgi:hypothetical protein